MINWKNPINHPVSQQALLTMSTHRHLDLHLSLSFSLSLLIFYPSFSLLPSSYGAIKTPLFLHTRWTWTAIVSMAPSEPSGERNPFDLQSFPLPWLFLPPLPINSPPNSDGLAGVGEQGQAEGSAKEWLEARCPREEEIPQIPVNSLSHLRTQKRKERKDLKPLLPQMRNNLAFQWET